MTLYGAKQENFNMQVIKEIIEHWGFVDSRQLPILAEAFPKTPLVIKWGMAQRQRVSADQVARTIEEGETSGDYCREVFIESSHFRQLKDVFGITE